jgi:hypothetical protein
VSAAFISTTTSSRSCSSLSRGSLHWHPPPIAANAVFAIVSLKGKIFTGFAAIALPSLGWVGALRLAKPASPWAHWFYGPDKLERAKQRMRDGFATRFQKRLLDLVGGMPSPTPQDPCVLEINR